MSLRLDAALVERGLARSRGSAQDLIAQGAVTINGTAARKPSQAIAPGDEVLVDSADTRLVGRAARKLEAGLAAFDVDPAGKRCIDIGASTGGFTQILLEAGAAEVACVDVGHGQLAATLGADPRVTDYSGTSIRGLQPETIGGVADILVADLSFISLTLVAEDLARLLRPGGQVIALIKPQFELSKRALQANGLVRKEADRYRAVAGVLTALAEHGMAPLDLIESPILGKTAHQKGNREYLVFAEFQRVSTDTGHPHPAAVTPSWEALQQKAKDLTKDRP